MITVPLNNMQTLTFKAQQANVFFATVIQMFCSASQRLTTAKHCFIVWTVFNDFITTHSAVVRSWGNCQTFDRRLAKNTFVIRALNLRVCMHAVIEGHSNIISGISLVWKAIIVGIFLSNSGKECVNYFNITVRKWVCNII